MGYDAHPILILGVQVTDADIFVSTEKQWRCRGGHERAVDGKYCPKDGLPFTEQSSKKIKPEILVLLGIVDDDDEDFVFDQATDANEKGGLALHQIDRLQGGEREAKIFALGVKLAEISNYDKTPDVLAFRLSADLVMPAEAIQAAARRVGIQDPEVRLFLCLYESY